MLWIIVVNAILVGVNAELMETEKDHHGLFQFLAVFDSFTLAMFMTEIALKWLDDFSGFWSDNWNVMDFVITLLVCPALV